MNDMITIPRSQLETLNSRITQLEQVIQRVAEKVHVTVDELEPLEGTDAWWDWAERQADEDVKLGRGTALHTKEDIDGYFQNL